MITWRDLKRQTGTMNDDALDMAVSIVVDHDYLNAGRAVADVEDGIEINTGGIHSGLADGQPYIHVEI